MGFDDSFPTDEIPPKPDFSLSVSPTEIKILNFLSQHKKKHFHMTLLTRKLHENGIKASYPTVLKYVDILIAKKLIKTEVFGNVKVVWYEG